MAYSLRRTRLRCAWTFAITVLLASAAVVAAPSLAWGAPFQRGDVFLSGGEYTPSGVLVQAAPTGLICFNPNGTRLVAPGGGLFDRSGNLLPSRWASVTNPGRCVADGFGNVYVAGPPAYPTSTITKYDIDGDPVETFTVLGASGIDPVAIDIAPDECTLYYHSYAGPAQIGRFNGCTGTQLSPLPGRSDADDLRVLPNWQVIETKDYEGLLYYPDAQNDPDAQNIIQSYVPADPSMLLDYRSMSLDPDGTSFWMSGAKGTARYDINSGRLLSVWCSPSLGSFCQEGPAGGSIAVYGPPLLGNANVAPNVDSTPAGTAEAFLTHVGYSGQLTRLHLYVDSSSTANQMTVGIYSNRLDRPGELLERGTITNVRPGSWNYVDVPSTPVTAGQFYWVAVLGPRGGGTASVRDRNFRGLAIVSPRHDLTDLPGQWSGGRWTLSGSLSAYGS